MSLTSRYTQTQIRVLFYILQLGITLRTEMFFTELLEQFTVSLRQPIKITIPYHRMKLTI